MNDPNLFDLPELPYAGTSGWSGSSTSKQRAIFEDTSGITSKRQTQILQFLSETRETGATWHEIGRRLDLHHGQVSGSLSNLHKAGRIVRLTETRDRSKIYVLTDHRAGRDIEPHKPNSRKTSIPDGMIAVFLPPHVAEAVATREATSILGHACRAALESQ